MDHIFICIFLNENICLCQISRRVKKLFGILKFVGDVSILATNFHNCFDCIAVHTLIILIFFVFSFWQVDFSYPHDFPYVPGQFRSSPRRIAFNQTTYDPLITESSPSHIIYKYVCAGNRDCHYRKARWLGDTQYMKSPMHRKRGCLIKLVW